MKQLAIIIIAITLFPLMLRAQNTDIIRQSEPVLSTAEYDEYGSELGEVGHSFGLIEAIDHIKHFADKEIVISSEVAQVCLVEGGWIILGEADRAVRVRFMDYAFFVPTDIIGKRVEARGMLSEVDLSEEEAKHFAEDAEAGSGASVSGAQREYSFMATAVRVYR